MIAASEPQEFVPSGRQQMLRHPGPFKLSTAKSLDTNDEFLLNKLEEVSLADSNKSEWWMLRRVPSSTLKKAVTSENNKLEKSELIYSSKSQVSDSLNESGSFLSATANVKQGRRVSSNSISKIHSLSVDADKRKSSQKINETGKISDVEEFHTKLDHGFMEEELYVKGNTVVWSQGLVNDSESTDNGRKIICSYTSPLQIKHALWCTFYLERPTYETSLLEQNLKLDVPLGTPVPAVCIIDLNNIRVYSPKGEDFVIAVPFQVGKVWSTAFGIFIEQEVDVAVKETLYENKATLYSLAYPLDDVCPVAINQGCLQVMNNSNLKIVFTSSEPSICMIYDAQTKQHSVYRIRHLKAEEKEIGERIHNDSNSFVNISRKLKSRLSVWDNSKSSNNLPVSKPTSIGSLCHIQSRSHSSMATISRCQSPAASSVGSPWLFRLNSDIQQTADISARTNRSFFDCSRSMSHLRSNPNICLEYIWTDSYSVQDESSACPASKVFLCDDLTGQWYLCYILLPRFQLSIVHIDFSNTFHINFGMVTSISAKDAVPIPHLHMLAILEHNGNVSLYSGLNIVGKLHVGGTLAQHTPSPYIRRNTPQFNSPFPRRSSLLPHCMQADPKFDEHLLSPVLPALPVVPRSSSMMQLSFQTEASGTPRAVLNGLTDAIESRLTLKYSDGTYYRITLPSLASSSLVEKCLVSLRQCLPRDATLTLLTRWYACRNVPGTYNINSKQEWLMFNSLIYELLGYEDDQPNESRGAPVTPSANAKRQKQSFTGNEEDWLYLTKSDHNHNYNNIQSTLKLNLPKTERKCSKLDNVAVNTKSVLFPFIRLIHYTLHLLYEDLKLNLLYSDDLPLLATILNKLANDLGLIEYTVLCWKDFPDSCKIGTNSISEADLKNATMWPGYSNHPEDIMQHIFNLLKGKSVVSYPYLQGVNERSKNIIQICGLLAAVNTNKYPEITAESFVKDISNISNLGETAEPSKHKTIYKEGVSVEDVILLMVQMEITPKYLETLPVGVYFLFYSALWKCRENPPPNWPAEAYYLLCREDLAGQVLKTERISHEGNSETYGMYSNSQLQEIVPTITKEDGYDQLDGMEDTDPLLKLRFPEDVRVAEARKMLQSSKPVPVVLVQRPDVTDHDFIEEQEKHLYAICTRTMALPIGRGMFSLRTATPVITEPLPTPQLCLTGKASPKGTTVELNHIDTPTNMSLWPLFHNGVANGLRITPDAHNIDNTWIIFNKPKAGVDQQMEHAGFLMALGLNGHSKNLAIFSTYDYLIKLHEMTSVGILLGLSAAFRGTSHVSLTKTLSIHVEALLPPTSMELDVPQNLQVAALLGVGLVYQRTAHRHMTEVLLSEIGRPPGPEMENSVDRESYSLAAGLALGLVTLKHGGRPVGLSDLNVPDTLHYYMVGGNVRPLTGSQKDKYKVPSFQIREGSTVNLDVTAPGATLALGLMYLGSGNKAVADWMAPPATQYLLDFVRPDFLMLRTLSRALILWNSITPSKSWVESQVPSTIRPHCMIQPTPLMDIDYEAMNQAYCNIVTGACFALGLKFAGSADEDAFETLLYFCHMFTSLAAKSIAELAGKPTIETCLNVLLLSAAMVMAGTGNLEIMRLVRHLRRRVGIASSAVVTYGSHLALHMALGLLFLGGGRYTLSNSPQSVAALICAFYPKFPTHSNDNRYHLQAFRHLYVLAVEPRLLIPKDVNLDKSCYANLQIIKLDGTIFNVKGPGIIPDLSTLYKVSVSDERYWPVVFERGRNWNRLVKILATTGYIEVKQYAGCLNYIVDKYGYHSQLARTLTQSETLPWDPPPSAIIAFTSEDPIKYFSDHFLSSNRKNESKEELTFKKMLTKITYDAVIKDKFVIILVFMTLLKIIKELNISPNTFTLRQFQLISVQLLSNTLSFNFVPKDIIISLEQKVVKILDKWEDDLKPSLQNYLVGSETNFDGDYVKKLAGYVTYYDIPFRCNVVDGDFLQMLSVLQSSGIEWRVVNKLLQICNKC